MSIAALLVLAAFQQVPVAAASDSLRISVSAGPPRPVSQPVEIHWADMDGDQDEDAVVRGADGRLRLLRNEGSIGFVDVTSESGLAELGGASCLLVGDVDGDGDPDLWLGVGSHVRLATNEDGLFVEPQSPVVDARSAVTGMHWVDADGDRRHDLHVAAAGAHTLLLNRPGGFEPVTLPLESGATNVVRADPVFDALHSGALAEQRSRTESDDSGRGTTGSAALSPPGSAGAGGSVFDQDPTDGQAGALACLASLQDQATGSCLTASSVPTLGKLYPISAELFVDAGTGRVGIGTVTPGYALEVAGQIVSGSGNTPSGTSAAIGGGSSNNAPGEHATIAGGELNQALADDSFIGGGVSNLVVGQRAVIGGGVGNSAANSAVVGGGESNSADFGFSTISGGRFNATGATYAVVGGGGNNQATGSHAVVGGGGDGADGLNANVASGSISTVAGGRRNVASDTGASVGGGEGNNATAEYGTVAGGLGNNVFAPYATVAGGRLNAAAGVDSMAAGRRAKALHDGSFVWADSTDADFSSTADDQYLIRAAGGVGIGKAPQSAFQLDVEGIVRASDTFVSTKAIGAPLQVTSTDLNTNLNADLLDGLDASAFSQFGNQVDGGELADGAVTDAKVAGAAAIAGTKITPDFGGQDVRTTGRVGVGTPPDFPLHVVGGGEVTAAGGGTVVIAGVSGGPNLGIDLNELQARTGFGSAAELQLNPGGGDLVMGSASSTVTISGTLQLPAGAAPGSFLSSDGAGNASWASVPDASWTPITALPFTISTPGAYYLAADLTGVPGSHGIEVTADDVLVDLNGHLLAGVPGSLNGVGALGTQRVRIRGGFVRGWGGHGVEVSDTSVIEDVVSSNNDGRGIKGDDAVRVSRCVVVSNIVGVEIESGCVEQTVAFLSGLEGIRVSGGSASAVVRRCTAEWNTGAGIYLDGGTVVDCVARNNGDTGFALLEGTQALRCFAVANQFAGYQVSQSSATQCTSIANGTDKGFLVFSESVVAGCRADSENAPSFDVTGSHSRIDGNHASSDLTGFAIGGTDNLVVRNSADAGTPYSIGPGNRDAAVLSPASGFSSSNAWANFEL